MYCSDCGKKITGKLYPNHLCQSCYNYYRIGGTKNPIPESGRLLYDKRGYVICHICGKAYKRLGSHVKESHNMTISEYKQKFELCNNTKTTEQTYSKHMHDLAYKYDMHNRLKIAGINTRIKKGENHLRKGKKIRLQEILNKNERNRKNI